MRENKLEGTRKVEGQIDSKEIELFDKEQKDFHRTNLLQILRFIKFKGESPMIPDISKKKIQSSEK